MAIIYAMMSMILFVTNLIIKFYNAFAIHKAIGKQASITKVLLTGIFGIFSQTLTQLVAQIQEEDTDNNNDDNNSHYGNRHNNSQIHNHHFRRHSTEIPTLTRRDKPTENYVDTNYKHYNTTISRTEHGLQIRTLESPTKKQRPPLPERKHKTETLTTIKESKNHPLPPIPPQLITPPPAYQRLSSLPPIPIPIPSAPNIEQSHTPNKPYPYETQIAQSTSYEIPQTSNTQHNQHHLIPTSRLLDIQNPPRIDFEQLKITNNKIQNRSHSLDILKNDQPHTNEVTYFDTHSADTYEI